MPSPGSLRSSDHLIIDEPRPGDSVDRTFTIKGRLHPADSWLDVNMVRVRASLRYPNTGQTFCFPPKGVIKSKDGTFGEWEIKIKDADTGSLVYVRVDSLNAHHSSATSVTVRIPT